MSRDYLCCLWSWKELVGFWVGFGFLATLAVVL